MEIVTITLESFSLLFTVNIYNDANINPKKQNILHARKSNFVKVRNISEILSRLEITPKNYYGELSISCNREFRIYSKLQPNERFLNNYFIEGLALWKAILIFDLFLITVR